MSCPPWRWPRSCSSGLNIFASNFFTDARLDLTQNGQFTLNQGTRNILAKLPEPVTLQFYYSRTTPARAIAATAAYAKRVRDLLGEYAALGHGKIILEEIDPEPFTPEEDQAERRRIDARRRPTGAMWSISDWPAPTASTASRRFPISPPSARPIWNMTFRR